MADDQESPKQSNPIDGVKASAVAGVAEFAIVIVGTALVGAAYSVGIHFLALVVVVPVVFYFFRKWIRGR
jgi:hypothetical protein